MNDFQLQRLGPIMEPEPGNPHEVEGVLNPAAVRGPDGGLYLFPRLVAEGNVSRIGIARVKFDEAGDPVGVERLGIALEPEADYERNPHGGGGCEDPRITFMERLKRYVMTYTALTPIGPRIALAVSELHGTIPNVVFPTAIDCRDDLGTPDRFDVYYGMADSRIGVASLQVPRDLPSGAPADAAPTRSEESEV